MGCCVSDAVTTQYRTTIDKIKSDIIGQQGQKDKAGFYSQPSSTGVGKELMELETGILGSLTKNSEKSIALEKEALALNCQTRYYETQLAMLNDIRLDPTGEKVRELNELLKFLSQEVHLAEASAQQKSQLTTLDEGYKVLSANLARFKNVDHTLEKLPEKQNVTGLPIFRDRLAKALAAQEEVTKNRVNHKPFVEKVATDKIKLTEELKSVFAENESVEKQYKSDMTNRKKLEDVYAHRKQTLGDLNSEINGYKENLDEFMVDYGNMTTQHHGGPPSPTRPITNPHNVIVA